MKTTNRIALLAATLAALSFLAPARRAFAQNQPAQLTVAIYAPTAAFSDAQARKAYVDGLAKAIQGKTNIPTKGQAYVRYEDLKRANPDFAIVDGLCVAVRKPGALLAVATIGGETSQRWALFARGGSLLGLKGQKIALARTGCSDEAFIENAMFDGEVKLAFFGAKVDRPDVAGAVAAVRDYKAAELVFAPATQGKGLSRVFDAGAVPTPGFVSLNKNLPAPLVDQVKTAVLSYGAGGGIDGWRVASSATYDSLSGRMGARAKKPVFATPELVRLEEEAVLVVPPVAADQATIDEHFREP